jgi:hypothetical protein
MVTCSGHSWGDGRIFGARYRVGITSATYTPGIIFFVENVSIYRHWFALTLLGALGPVVFQLKMQRQERAPDPSDSTAGGNQHVSTTSHVDAPCGSICVCRLAWPFSPVPMAVTRYSQAWRQSNNDPGSFA